MFLEKNDFVMTLLLFIHCSASSWKWHALFLYYIYDIEENYVSKENLCYIICYLKIKTALWKYFYRVFIIA